MRQMMMTKLIRIKCITKIFLYVILFWLHDQNILAQNDFESWNCITAEYKFTSKITAWTSQELRLNDNATHLAKYLSDFGVEYKILKKLKFNLAYRYTRFNDNEIFKNENMFYGILEYSYKINRFTISVNERYERAYQLNGYSVLDKLEVYNRNKAIIDYNIYKSPLLPYISYELFTYLNNPGGIQTDKYRLFLGLKYKIKGKNVISCYYGIRHSLIKPENSYILGLKYAFKFSKDKDEE